MKSKPELGNARGSRNEPGPRGGGGGGFKPREAKPAAGNDWFTQALGKKN
jgi:hypothetical protein